MSSSSQLPIPESSAPMTLPHWRLVGVRKLRTYGGRSGCNEFVFQRA